MKTLHLFILCTLAFAQPLFNVLAGNSTFFVAHGSEPVDLFAMIVLLCVAIPAILALIEWIASAIHPKAAGSIHAFFIVILVALIALPFLNHLRASSTVIFLMAGVLGVALVAVYFRWK